MSYSDNIAAVDRDLREQFGDGSHELEVQNTMEYASYLQDRHGYYVFNDKRLREHVVQWLKKTARQRGLTDKTIPLALDASGFAYVGFLQSLTSQMRPPVRAGQGPRRAHPGGWSDVTSNLANAYRHRVNGGPYDDHTYSG